MRNNNCFHINRREFAAALLAAPLMPGLLQKPQIEDGTGKGMSLVKLAVPEFRPVRADAKINQLADIFNKVLWDDLDFSGNLALVSRSFYPLGNFVNPADVRPDDWMKTGIDAQYITYGSVEIGTEGVYRGAFAASLHFTDLKTNQAVIPAVKFGGGLDSEEAARLVAHSWANLIIENLGLGKGIARTQIAYVSERGDVKEIYTMDYDGFGPYPRTALRDLALTPAWSPDGTRIAFNGYRKNVSNIEIVSLSDGKSTPFPNPAGTINTTPAWSPDGTRIAFASSRDKHGTNDGSEIYVANATGQNIARPLPRPAGTKGVDIAPVWNPANGRQIAFVSDRSGTQQIYRMNHDGTNVTRLIDEGGDAENPSWSPDGTFLAFAWKRSGSGFDIYLHNLVTGDNTRLTKGEGDNEKPTWSPDGKHLAFQSDRSGKLQIYSMLADGGKLRQLTRTGINKAPAWSGFLK